MDDHVEKMKSWQQGRELRGLILLDHIFRHDPRDGWCACGLTYFVNLCEHNQRRAAEFRAFVQAFERGLPNFQMPSTSFSPKS